MANPLHNLLQNQAVAAFYNRAVVLLTGFAHDFWKDGTENPFHPDKAVGTKPPHPAAAKASAAVSSASSPEAEGGWHAAPGEISEKMWGDGFVAPGGDVITDMLIKPLGLTKDMNILDLSAGLGGPMRRATEESGVYITGLEPDAEIAARGMEMSIKAGKKRHDAISHYAPADFVPGKTVTRLYDGILARETFYRVKNKKDFFDALAACTKPQAHIAFTDYIVNPEHLDKPAILKWIEYENATPFGLVEMAEAWAKAGFKLRVHDDQTEYYHKEVLSGLKRFKFFLASGVNPDSITRKAIFRRLETWTHRMAAMDEGMKFYRFYGTK